MNSYIVNVQIERETRRVAAAFGVHGWHETYSGNVSRHYVGFIQDIRVEWGFEMVDAALGFIEIQQGKASIIHLLEDTTPWASMGYPHLDKIMACGLHRLGIEFNQLPEFSAHEKLELRLSLPREFWPKSWFDEEENAVK